MKVKKMLCLVLTSGMLCSMTAFAAPEETSDYSASEDAVIEYLESFRLDKIDPINMDEDEVADLFAGEGDIQPYVTEPDGCEPNDTISTAYPYDQMPIMTPRLTSRNELFTLGMRYAGLHSEEDEDWYSINLTAGEDYFVDIRNLGSNWFIQLYYIKSDGTGYFYTTDSENMPVFIDKTERYFYFTAEDTGTYYIRVANGGDWSDEMYYYFYVGPAIQNFDIVGMPTYGGVNLLGGDYRTYTCDLSRMAVPAQTAIINLSMSDNFGTGTVCPEVAKYMSAGGKTYYNTVGNNSNVINNIAGASLGQVWTIGGKCTREIHYTYWSGVLNGRFACIMAPYPGNEVSF